MEASNNFPLTLLEVKTARGKKFILIEDISYIKGSSKHCYVFFANAEPMLEVHCMLKWFTEHLPEPQFCRCHDSFIVNFRYYDCVNGSNIILKDNSYIPVAPLRKSSTIEKLKVYLMQGRNNSLTA
ncbi:MAG: LytTR family transcriptional regulator [Bacteroidales bacterium]|nr:LytTR family transcriptional regulator [Bacteroidales bacterium]